MVRQVLLDNGSAEVKDDLTGQVFHIEDLNFSLPFLSSLKADQQTDIAAQLRFTLNQAPVSLLVEGRPFLPERPAKARLHIEKLKLDPFWAYPKVPEGLIPESHGILACDLAFHYAHDPNQKTAGHRIGLNGKARVEEIGIDLVDQGPLARVPGLDIELDTEDLLSQGLKIARILVDHPEFSVHRDSSKRIVLLNVLGPQGGTENSTDPGGDKGLPEKGEIPETPDTDKSHQPGLTLLVDEARIDDGKLLFSDASVNDGFKSELSKISIGIKDFRMDPSVSADVQGEVTTGSDEQIEFKAQVKDKAGISVNGEVVLKNGHPMSYAPYLGGALKNAFRLDRVNAAAGFSLVLNQGRVSGQVNNGEIGLTGIRVFDLDGKQTIIGIPDVQIKGIGLDLDKQLLTVDAAESAKGEISILRSADGSVNLVRRIKALTDSAGSGGATEPAPPWHFLVRQVKADGWAVSLTDHGRQPVSINLSDIRIEASNLTSTGNETGKLLADLTWQKNGSIRIRGDLDLVKPKADLNFNLAGIDIGTFQPYFTDFLNIDITDGLLKSAGSLSVEPGKADPVSARFKGKTVVSEFKSRNKATGNDFFKCKSLYLTGMDVSVFPVKVDITEIALTDFYSRVVLLKDGTLNFRQVLVRDKKALEETASAQEFSGQDDETKGTVPRFNIQAVTLQGGHINFSDYFTKPNFKANMTEIAGSIQNLSSVSEEPAEILLKGVHGLNSPLDINGTLKPFGQRSADIDLSFKNIELTEFNAYSVKYLGYEIEKGKLMVDLKYKIAGNELESSNRFFLDQFTLGNRVESKDATSLPVALAVSLLKNPQDEIDLDIPIKGNLDDPDFDFSGVVFETVKNLILGVVAAPFNFMGKLFFDGAEELGYVTFAPASHTLDAENKGKLDRLMDILEKKTGLELAIKGAWDPGLDAEGIRAQAMKACF